MREGEGDGLGEAVEGGAEGLDFGDLGGRGPGLGLLLGRTPPLTLPLLHGAVPGCKCCSSSFRAWVLGLGTLGAGGGGEVGGDGVHEILQGLAEPGLHLRPAQLLGARLLGPLLDSPLSWSHESVPIM